MDDVESHSIKDIQNLLENADQTQGASWRKYARLVLPHVGLVTVVCVYAMVGAWVFYAIESPHEDRLKIKGVQRIQQMRRDLTELVWERHDKELGQLTRDEWISKVRQNLQLFNENLYRAYKDQYVRYGDVRLSKREPLGHDPRIKRHRSSKSRSEKGGKLWTASSSLFFAATTMATIGYGNIVPVTNYGRIACIVFALFGAPLAIITIGDLGKFLSECTIWLYRRIKEKSRILRYHLKNWSWRKQGVITEVDQMSLSRNSGGIGTQSNMDMSEWDDLEKAEVPVLLVFAILLLYIAFGGVLFAILESWTYMDAFYYCFVSLTTIGFGDLVPDRHEYIVLMLIYLGVGLAVTTMCIDLVGIQYIQKIHYFGRKFKGTDILQILRRKRMLERRFAMGEGKEFIEYVIQVTQETRGFHPPSSRSIMPPVKIASQFYSRDDEEEKLSLQSEKEAIMPWSLDDINVDTTPLTQLPLAQKAPTPEVISAKSLSPLPPPLSSRSMTPLTNSTDSARSLMYEKWTARNRSQRDNSWAESGPDVSVRCSISTTPSVQEREFIYNNFRSPAPSVMSFQFSFPLPSPDLRIIAEASRNARRVTSCPSIIKHTSTPAQTPTPVSSITSSVRRKWKSFRSSLYRASTLQFAYPPVLLSLASPYNTADNASRMPLLDQNKVSHINSGLLNQSAVKINVPNTEIDTFLSTKLATQYGRLDNMENGLYGNSNVDTTTSPPGTSHQLLHFRDMPPVWAQPDKLTTIMESPQSNEKARAAVRPEVFRHKRMGIQPVWFYRRRSLLLSTISGMSQQQTSTSALNQPPMIVEENKPRPVLKRKKLERLARRTDPLREVDWLNVSPRMALMEAVKEELPAFVGQYRTSESSASSHNEREGEDSTHSSIAMLSPRNPIGLSCMEEWESYTRMLDEYLKPVKRAPTPVAIEKLRKCSAELAHLDFVVENPPEPQPMTPPPPEPEPPRPSAMTIAMGAIAMATTSFSKVMAYPDPPKPPSPPPLLPIIGSVDWEIDLHSATPILDSHSATVVNLELTPAAFDPCHSPRVVNVAHTARSEISLPCYRHSISGELEPGSEELQEIPIFGHVAQKAQISDTVGSGYDMSEAKMHKTASPPLLVTLQREDMEKEKIDFEDAVSSIVSSSSSEIEEEEESGSKSSEPVFDIDLGAFELVDSGVTAEALLSQEEPVIYHKDMPVHSVHHDTVQTEAAIENLMNAPPSMLSSVVPPTMVADNYCFVVDGDKINMGDILGDEQWWRHTSRPTKYFYSEDMKRFYRVTCLSARGKVIAARLANTVPAMGGNGHGQHQTEPPDSPTKRRLRSLSSTRDSIVSGHSASPRIVNAQSGAFGSSPAGLSGASRGQQGQQQTAGGSGSYPGTAFQSYATTPRSSMAYQHGPLRCEVGQRGERVDLTNVYKVVRFYSFWKTCTSFHRIVTMIEKVAPAEENESKEEEESEDDRDLREVCTPTLNFHKRLFVQYLWRNAKPMEKARVQKEFDPRRQRLLRFVTDTAARKRVGNLRTNLI